MKSFLIALYPSATNIPLKLTSSLIGVLLLMGVQSTQAMTTYQYMGNNYDTIIRNDDPPAGTFTTSMAVNGYFVTEDPLITPVFTDISGLITDYSFDNGRNILTSANSTIIAANAFVDAAGDLFDWQLFFSGTGVGDGDLRPSVRIDRVVGDLAFLQICGSVDSDGNCDSILADSQDAASAEAGSWSVAAVPIPTAVWLFGTALIGLVGFSKRRKAA